MEEEAAVNTNKGKRILKVRKLKCKIQAAPGRGSIDADVVLDAVTSNWDALQESYNNLDDDEKDELKGHFNQIFETRETLGDALFTDLDDWTE